MNRKILHLLSQRPGRTGSGVTLDSKVRFSAKAGWEQAVIVGSPTSEPQPIVGELESESIHPLFFESDELPYPVPGMSDVMPYRSTRFSELSDAQIDRYKRAWRDHLSRVVGSFQPDLIHSNHLWLLSSMVKDVAPELPMVLECHATGMRQMKLCPHLAEEVKTGCARADRFQVLSAEHAMGLSTKLNVPLDRVHVVSSGYREDLFHQRGRSGDGGGMILYVGKLSRAKGLPWLLDAFDRLRGERRSVELHVAGSGGGRGSCRYREALERNGGHGLPRHGGPGVTRGAHEEIRGLRVTLVLRGGASGFSRGTSLRLQVGIDRSSRGSRSNRADRGSSHGPGSVARHA